MYIVGVLLHINEATEVPQLLLRSFLGRLEHLRVTMWHRLMFLTQLCDFIVKISSLHLRRTSLFNVNYLSQSPSGSLLGSPWTDPSWISSPNRSCSIWTDTPVHTCREDSKNIYFCAPTTEASKQTTDSTLPSGHVRADTGLVTPSFHHKLKAHRFSFGRERIIWNIRLQSKSGKLLQSLTFDLWRIKSNQMRPQPRGTNRERRE